MRIKIVQNDVSTFIGDKTELVFKKESPHSRAGKHSRIGIFYRSQDQYLGGWLKLPLPFEFHFEAVSYSKRDMGSFVTLEILVETEEHLLQIGHHLVKHLDNWRMLTEISAEPPTYELYQEFITEVDDYLKKIDSILIEANQDMSWEEAQGYDSNDIKKRIQYYNGIIRSRNVPKKFLDDSSNLRISLDDLEKRTHEDLFFDPILERELISFQSYIEEKTEYYTNSLETLTLEGLSSLSKQINDIEAEFRDFWIEVNRMSSIRGLLEKNKETRNRINSKFTSLTKNIQNHNENLEKIQQQKEKQRVIERTVLQQLRELTPGIQTLLVRISELTGFDKDIVEPTIITLLENHPEIGGYDIKSQVFILGENMPKKINNLLEEYPIARSFEESIILLEEGKEPNVQEMSHLVTQTYKRIESVLRFKVKSTERLDFIDNINLAFEQKIINDQEKNDLHQFRSIRNQFVHEDREDFPKELVLKIDQIQKRINTSVIQDVQDSKIHKPSSENQGRKNSRSRW